jgi:hypothetical protein
MKDRTFNAVSQRSRVRQAGWRRGDGRWDGKRSFGFALAGVRMAVGGRGGGRCYPVRESTGADRMALIGRTVESGKAPTRSYSDSRSLKRVRVSGWRSFSKG